jgi:hypothetical protein
MKQKTIIIAAIAGAALFGAVTVSAVEPVQEGFDAEIAHYGQTMLDEGKETFRYETFGSEAFWGDALQLHKAIAGEKNGGLGPGVSPKTALSVGLKVDADVLPDALKKQIKAGKVNLDDPASLDPIRAIPRLAQASVECRILYVLSGPCSLTYAARLGAAYSASVRVGCGICSWTFSVSGEVEMGISGHLLLS